MGKQFIVTVAFVIAADSRSEAETGVGAAMDAVNAQLERYDITAHTVQDGAEEME